jgi:transposase
MPRTHPSYAAEYRRRIVELARAGRNLGDWRIRTTVETIRQWVKQAELDEGLRSDGLTTSEREVNWMPERPGFAWRAGDIGKKAAA